MVSHGLFEILPGLPPYGPPPRQFSETGAGTHSEGFVVRFAPVGSDPWVGNFQPGLTSLHQVITHPNGTDLIVVAGGLAYVIDPSKGTLITSFGGQIELAHKLENEQAVLFGNGLWFEKMEASGFIWRSRRLSWDGIKDLTIANGIIAGAGWCFDDTWHDFEVDISSGAARGGAYGAGEF